MYEAQMVQAAEVFVVLLKHFLKKVMVDVYI